VKDYLKNGPAEQVFLKTSGIPILRSSEVVLGKEGSFPALSSFILEKCRAYLGTVPENDRNIKTILWNKKIQNYLWNKKIQIP
jgi:hypothetical protein